MAKYIMQRILAMLVTLFIIITIGFMVIRLMPGGIFDDAVDMTYEQRTALEAKYNLDKPIPIQYAMFLKGLVLEGDWGTSLKMYVNVPVWDVIKTKIPVTLYINFFFTDHIASIGDYPRNCGGNPEKYDDRLSDIVSGCHIYLSSILYLRHPASVFCGI